MLRRVASILLATAGVGLTVLAAEQRSAPPPARVVVAAGDLSGGTRLGVEDVETTHVPAAAAPPGAVSAAEAVGRRLVGPIAAGEVLTATRLRADDTRDDGRVAVHLLAEDAVALDLVGVGSVVTVYPAGGGAALTRDGVVVAVDAASTAGSASDLDPWAETGAPPGRGLVVAVAPVAVDRLFAGQRPLEGPPVVSVVPSA